MHRALACGVDASIDRSGGGSCPGLSRRPGIRNSGWSQVRSVHLSVVAIVLKVAGPHIIPLVILDTRYRSRRPTSHRGENDKPSSHSITLDTHAGPRSIGLVGFSRLPRWVFPLSTRTCSFEEAALFCFILRFISLYFGTLTFFFTRNTLSSSAVRAYSAELRRTSCRGGPRSFWYFAVGNK